MRSIWREDRRRQAEIKEAEFLSVSPTSQWCHKCQEQEKGPHSTFRSPEVLLPNRVQTLTQQNLRSRQDRRRSFGGYLGSWPGSRCPSGASTSWWWGFSSCRGPREALGWHRGSCRRCGRPRSAGSRKLVSTCTKDGGEQREVFKWEQEEEKVPLLAVVGVRRAAVVTSLSSRPFLSRCGASYASICCLDTRASFSASSLHLDATSTAVVNKTKSRTSLATRPWQSIFNRAWSQKTANTRETSGGC